MNERTDGRRNEGTNQRERMNDIIEQRKKDRLIYSNKLYRLRAELRYVISVNV